jgi:hypothetical protein
MASLDISSECEDYFRTYWAQTALEYITLSKSLDTTALNEYISIRYFSLPTDKLIGFGHKRTNGYLRVMVYQRKEALALGLADDVKEFFDNVDLPKDIHVDIGQDYPVLDMNADWFEIKLTFDIVQYS